MEAIARIVDEVATAGLIQTIKNTEPESSDMDILVLLALVSFDGDISKAADFIIPRARAILAALKEEAENGSPDACL